MASFDLTQSGLIKYLKASNMGNGYVNKFVGAIGKQTYFTPSICNHNYNLKISIAQRKAKSWKPAYSAFKKHFKTHWYLCNKSKWNKQWSEKLRQAFKVASLADHTTQCQNTVLGTTQLQLADTDCLNFWLQRQLESTDKFQPSGQRTTAPEMQNKNE